MILSSYCKLHHTYTVLGLEIALVSQWSVCRSSSIDSKNTRFRRIAAKIRQTYRGGLAFKVKIFFQNFPLTIKHVRKLFKKKISFNIVFSWKPKKKENSLKKQEIHSTVVTSFILNVESWNHWDRDRHRQKKTQIQLNLND